MNVRHYYPIASVLGLLLLALSINAQVRVSGNVVHADEPVTDVTIKVIENGDVLRTMLADRKGRFETDIPFGKNYTLLFVRPFMLPVAIDVSTSEDAESEVHYDVPLKMRMYNRYSGMSESLARKSIGRIERTGTGENAFTFVPYVKVIEELKPLYAESERREAEGEQPIASEVFFPETTPEAVTKNIDRAGGTNANPSDANAPDGPEKAIAEESLDRSGREAGRFEEVERSKEIERERILQSMERSGSAKEKAERAGADYIDASKQLRRELEMQDDTRNLEIAEARIQKQADQGVHLESVHMGASPTMDQSASKLVKHSVDAGMFVYDERLLIELAGTRFEYRKAVYNWLLFDVTYYSKDDKEISEEEFDEVKRTFGI
ncbi:MAG: hypothetical protein RLP15_03020 [Cryomorphaceae bacterium]